MKFLKKVNNDSKQIIQDLCDSNDSLIDVVREHQIIIFELKETIERLKNELAEPHRFEEE